MAIAALSSTAMAQQPDAFDACAPTQDPAVRLACFDHAVSARRATHRVAAAAPPIAPAPVARSAPAAAAAAAPGPARAADPDVGLDAREQRRQRAERGVPDQPPSTAIEATIVRVIPRGPLISAFELSNGQVWEQSESMKFSAEPRQTITIRPGLLGAFFLKNAAGVAVRVHRVK